MADHIKLRDLPPFSLRLHPDMRAALEREAQINRRTLSSEIMARLRASLEEGPARLPNVVRAEEPVPTGFQIGARTQQLSDHQRMLLAAYEVLPPEKQLALLTFLKR